jgi:PiT family inorganic phosphate transporter
MLIAIIGSFLLGWSLGANDAANVFGTAVSTRMVRWRNAALLTALFVILGAWLQGRVGVHTVSTLTVQTPGAAATAVFAAALTVALLTALRLPVSTSQAVVGSIIGVGLIKGELNTSGLTKVILCWLGTPIGAILLYVLLYGFSNWLIRTLRLSIFTMDSVQRVGLVLAGCYGAYALGANNVANIAGPLVQSGAVGVDHAVIIGATSIAAGVVMLSKPVMLTVGRGIAKLDGLSALLVVLAASATVHIYAFIGVPVSTSQAAVGAVLGIGLVRGLQVIHWRTLRNVLLGWLGTPVIAVACAALIYFLSHLEYAP